MAKIKKDASFFFIRITHVFLDDNIIRYEEVVIFIHYELAMV